MSLPTCPGCGQLVDVGYDGPKVAIRPLQCPARPGMPDAR